MMHGNQLNMKKDILYPCFLQLVESTDDYFWKNIFEDMAYGICPYGTYIHQGTLYCNLKDKKISFYFLDKPIEEIRSKVLTYFRTKLNLTTSKEYAVIRSQIESALSMTKYREWRDIRKRNIQTILIINYSIHLADLNAWSTAQTQKFLKTVSTAITFKTIAKDDIVYDKSTCSIQLIKGI